MNINERRLVVVLEKKLAMAFDKRVLETDDSKTNVIRRLIKKYLIESEAAPFGFPQSTGGANVRKTSGN